tara:strand:+ start:10110 stop:10235 length:126 start_codon:yes stop_codon:yes gene_type:complete
MLIDKLGTRLIRLNAEANMGDLDAALDEQRAQGQDFSLCFD